MSDRIFAPFTPEQVRNLNGYQESGAYHPYTCRSGCRVKVEGYEDAASLLAEEKGLVCPVCGHVQAWAWEFTGGELWKNTMITP
jgi:hypothetical protein